MTQDFSRQRLQLFMQRMPADDVEVATAQPIGALPEVGRMQAVARHIVSDAASVAEKELGFRRRRRYADFTCDLVPELPSTFLGRVKLGSLRTIVALEAELTARRVTGWVSTAEANASAELRRSSLPQMRALLQEHCDADGYLVGGQMGSAATTEAEEEEAEYAELDEAAIADDDAADAFDAMLDEDEGLLARS
eukprot:SAG31_NODE_2404_length_5763_cov_6.902560_4_plen_194_part_00